MQILKSDISKFFIKWLYFVPAVFIIAGVAGLSLYEIKYAKPEYDINESILYYQLDKIKKSIHQNTDTIFVGDSSCGNAINAETFSSLSQRNVVNLCLTGSYGIAGSLLMAKLAVRHFPQLKNIVLMQTLDIWRRPFPKEGYLRLSLREQIFHDFSSIGTFDYAQRLLNLSSVWQFITYKKSDDFLKMWGYYISDKSSVDFITQREDRFSKGIRKSGTEMRIKMHTDKSEELTGFNDFCCSHPQIKCVITHGPLIDQVGNNYVANLAKVNWQIKNQANCIQPIPESFFYSFLFMGDNIDHVDPDSKNKVTQDYFVKIKRHLQEPSDHTVAPPTPILSSQGV